MIGPKVIGLTDPDWRAVRLKDASSVEYLNRMFRRGWYIMPLDINGISHFIMMVPLDNPTRVDYASYHQRIAGDAQPSMVIVVLRKGEQKGIQRAILAEIGESGKVEMKVRRIDQNSLRPIAWLKLEEGGMVVLFERATPGG